MRIVVVVVVVVVILRYIFRVVAVARAVVIAAAPVSAQVCLRLRSREQHVVVAVCPTHVLRAALLDDKRHTLTEHRCHFSGHFDMNVSDVNNKLGLNQCLGCGQSRLCKPRKEGTTNEKPQRRNNTQPCNCI